MTSSKRAPLSNGPAVAENRGPGLAAVMTTDKDSWDEVANLRDLAGKAAADGVDWLAALYDTRASQMAERLRAEKVRT